MARKSKEIAKSFDPPQTLYESVAHSVWLMMNVHGADLNATIRDGNPHLPRLTGFLHGVQPEDRSITLQFSDGQEVIFEPRVVKPEKRLPKTWAECTSEEVDALKSQMIGRKVPKDTQKRMFASGLFAPGPGKGYDLTTTGLQISAEIMNAVDPLADD